MLKHDPHACTDVTGFGLLGHALQMANASRVRLRLHHRAVPHFPTALDLLAGGMTSGGIASNRAAFSSRIEFAPEVPASWRDLLFDPQTSGGLLIAAAPARAEVLVADLGQDGVAAAVVGEILDAGEGRILVD